MKQKHTMGSEIHRNEVDNKNVIQAFTYLLNVSGLPFCLYIFSLTSKECFVY